MKILISSAIFWTSLYFGAYLGEDWGLNLMYFFLSLSLLSSVCIFSVKLKEDLIKPYRSRKNWEWLFVETSVIVEALILATLGFPWWAGFYLILGISAHIKIKEEVKNV